MNGQYYYVPSQVIEKDGILFLPTESLAESLGCSLEEEPETGTLRMRRSGSLPTSPTYPEEDLYWLSRAIYAEAGNQPMAGRIAVGTVILNRVAHESFPRYGAGGHICPWSVLSGGKRDHLSHSR